ncbi:MAG: hypothetical protein N4J56_000717 [Chroococcidiopsis sp. SAG 2025]|nr:hypothetical protein [Chroococcidiopsis sp. SAG 2025]
MPRSRLYSNTVHLRLRCAEDKENRRIGSEGVARCLGFFERNLDTGFFTTLGLVRETRSGNRVSKISTVNQLKKRGVLVIASVEISG